MLHVVILVFVLLGSSLAEDVTDRLARVESMLAEVLDKNTRLEEENIALKQTSASLEKRIQELEETTKDVRPSRRSQTTESRSSKRFVADFQAQTVAFSAVVSPPKLTNLGASQPIVYDKTITNIGGAYHNGSGVFTAPIGGAYAFNFAVMMDPGISEYIDLVKNGKTVMVNYGHAPGSTHYISASRTATVELMVGDQVWIKTGQSSTHGDGIIHGNGFTTFSGWLIQMYE